MSDARWGPRRDVRGPIRKRPSAGPSSSPSAQAVEPADHVLADPRPVLEAVAGPAAHDPGVLPGRVAVHDEVAVGRRLVLADAALEERCRGEVGEAPGEEGPGQPEVVGVGDPLAGRWVEARPHPVDPDLEAAVVGRGDAVAAAGVVRPARHRLCPEAHVAGSRPEVEDRLARHRDERAADVGEELGEPGTGREDERLGAPAAPVGVDHVEESPAGLAPGADARERVRAAGTLECADGRLDATPRPQEAGLRLVKAEGEAGRVDRRPAPADLVGGEPLDRDPERSQRPLGVGLPAVVGRREPENPGRLEQPDAPLLLDAQPVGERPARPARVERVVAVGAADDAVLVRGGGPEVAGAPRVEERDAPVTAQGAVRAGTPGPGPVRGPGTHDAGAHDEEVGRRRRLGGGRRDRRDEAAVAHRGRSTPRPRAAAAARIASAKTRSARPTPRCVTRTRPPASRPTPSRIAVPRRPPGSG